MEINKKTKLNMETIEVKGNIFDALINLSSFDKNYISSASEEAAAQGFASNQEYHVFQVKTLMAEGFFVEEHEIVDAFCDMWMADKEHIVTCHYSDEDKIDYIVIAFVD